MHENLIEKQLIEERDKLFAQYGTIKKEATKEVSEKIKEITLRLDKIKLERQNEHRKEFEEMASVVGDMFRMAFELYTVKGIDINLELVNHVQWISIKHKNIQGRLRFADTQGIDGHITPNHDGLKKAYEAVFNTYNEVMNNG